MNRKARMPVLVGALAASLAIATVTLGSTGGSPAQAATTWTGTWAASPQSGGQAINQQTLRPIVHTSIGGTAARVQLSNVFGTQPVTIADVHVAQRTSGSTVSTGTDRTSRSVPTARSPSSAPRPRRSRPAARSSATA